MEEQPITLATHVAVGTAPTLGVSLRPTVGFAAGSSISMPTPSRCCRKASPRRERGQELAAPGAPAASVAQSQLLTPLVATAQPTLPPRVSHRAAPQVRRPPSAICGTTAEGGLRHLAEEQVNQVNSAPTTGGSSGRQPLAVILAIIGVLAIIAGILYVAGAANSLHFMVGSVHKGHHLVRAAVSFVVGIALLIGAWFAARQG